MQPIPTERCSVLIIGSGPAGLAAALQLRKQGVTNIKVVEREAEAGGMPRFCNHTGFGLRDLQRLHSGPSYARAYRQRTLDAGIALETATTITGWVGPHAVTATSPAGVKQIEATVILLATGCRERPAAARLIPGYRPLGIFTPVRSSVLCMNMASGWVSAPWWSAPSWSASRRCSPSNMPARRWSK